MINPKNVKVINSDSVIKYHTEQKMKDLEKLFYVSTGNEKLVSNKSVLFLIWNIPARVTCPYATEHCKELCYAVKAENVYPDCLPSRQRNFDFSRSELFVPYMIEFIKIKLNHLKAGRKIAFRIHESGDFYNQEYVKKWLQIINYFKEDKRIKFMAYTKSVLFFVGCGLHNYKNFVLRFSIWDDTNKAQLVLAKKLGLSSYTALTEEQLANEDKTTYYFCDCVNCGTCLACYNDAVKRIICLIH